MPKIIPQDDVNMMGFDYAVDLLTWADDGKKALAWKWKRVTHLQGGITHEQN